jgi:hypothetical protein
MITFYRWGNWGPGRLNDLWTWRSYLPLCFYFFLCKIEILIITIIIIQWWNRIVFIIKGISTFKELRTIIIPILQISKPWLRKVKYIMQVHTLDLWKSDCTMTIFICRAGLGFPRMSHSRQSPCPIQHYISVHRQVGVNHGLKIYFISSLFSMAGDTQQTVLQN